MASVHVYARVQVMGTNVAVQAIEQAAEQLRRAIDSTHGNSSRGAVQVQTVLDAVPAVQHVPPPEKPHAVIPTVPETRHAH